MFCPFWIFQCLQAEPRRMQRALDPGASPEASPRGQSAHKRGTGKPSSPPSTRAQSRRSLTGADHCTNSIPPNHPTNSATTHLLLHFGLLNIQRQPKKHSINLIWSRCVLKPKFLERNHEQDRTFFSLNALDVNRPKFQQYLASTQS